MNSELTSFKVLRELGPTNRNGAVAAILCAFTVASLLKRSNEKITFKANEVLQRHPPLVLLSKVLELLYETKDFRL